MKQGLAMNQTKTVIPAAYIFTDAIYERYEQQYASTLSEWMVVDEELEKDEENDEVSFYVASAVSMLGLAPHSNYMFVVYTPNKKRLAMAAFGDFDKLIVVVDSYAKKLKIKKFHTAASDLYMLANDYYSFKSELKIKLEYGSLPDLIEPELFDKEFKQASDVHVDAFNKMRAKLIADFKSEFCCSVSFAKRFSE
jgi:hypothetical protein